MLLKTINIIVYIGVLNSAGDLQATSVLMQHNDFGRTGANLGETVLNTNNVNTAQFGKLFNRPVDGQIYGQILYAPNVLIPGKGTANVIFAVTMHNSVYAFDADQPSASQPLWSVNLGTPLLCTQIPGCNRDILPEIGILSTPVIDSATNTIFLVAETFENNIAVFRLHALNITNGEERLNSPTVIAGSVPGKGPGSAQGTMTFDAFMHWQRAGLLLYRNTVYMGFGSHQDTQPYRGWLFAYDATTLQRTAIRCMSPNGPSAGVWQGGSAPAVDAVGNIYVQTGHGIMSGMAGQDFGISMVKLNAATLQPLDFFSPTNEQALSDDDDDFGSSGPLLIPNTPYVVGGGKDGKLFVVDTNNMGRYDPAQNHVIQFWQATTSEYDTHNGGIFGGNVWYNDTLYMWGRRDVLKAFSWTGNQFNTTPSSTTNFAVADGYSSEPALSISANGLLPGSSILWAVTPNYGSSNGGNFPGTLHAFDASNVGHELWNSGQNPARDSLGSWSKWTAPTVVNGKVYVATFDSGVAVYGILPSSAQVKLLNAVNIPTPVNLTAEGTTDWIHWGEAIPSRKAGAAPQLSDYHAVGAASQLYLSDLRVVSWSDGGSIPVSFGNTNAVGVYGIGLGQSFTVPAETHIRVLTIHAGGISSAGRLSAHLSDMSAPDLVQQTSSIIGPYTRDFTIQYQSASPGQTLTVSWVSTTRTGGVTLNSASLITGQLTGSALLSSTADLSAEGTIDWIHLGETPPNRKAGINRLLPDLVPITENPVHFYSNDLRAVSWNDGSPVSASSGNRNGLYINGTGSGFSLQAPASLTAKTIRVHLGGFSSGARLTATLSDSSASSYVDEVPYADGQYIRDYVITFRSATPNQTLNLSWTMTSGGGNVTFNAASLAAN